MDQLVIPGATIFMFSPVEKKWRLKANGEVTFSLNVDLQISVGNISYFVKGGVRSKGTRSVVMRIRDERTKDKGARILACRFERSRDVKNLFTLISRRRKNRSGGTFQPGRPLRTPPS